MTVEYVIISFARGTRPDMRDLVAVEEIAELYIINKAANKTDKDL